MKSILLTFYKCALFQCLELVKRSLLHCHNLTNNIFYNKILNVLTKQKTYIQFDNYEKNY